MNFDEAYRKQYGRAPFEGVTEWDGRDRYSVPSQAAARPAAPGSAAWPPPGVRDPSEGGRTDSSAEREVDLDLADPLSPLYRADDLGDEAHAETGMIHETEKQEGTDMTAPAVPGLDQTELALSNPSEGQPAAVAESAAHPLALELAESMGHAPVSVEAFKRNIDLVRRIREAVLDMLVPVKHYGTMPGVSKPFLYESGAHELELGFNVYPVHENREREGTDSFLESGETFPVWEVTSRAHLTWRHNGKVAYTGPECVCSSAEAEFLCRLWDHESKGKFPKQIKAVPLSALKQPIMHQAQKRATVEAIRNLSGAGDTFTQDPEIAAAAGKTTTPEQLGERNAPRPVIKGKVVTSGRPAPAAAPPPAAKPAPAPIPAPAPAPAANDKPKMPTKERFIYLLNLCAKVTPKTTVPKLMGDRRLPPPLLDVDCMKLIAELEDQLKGAKT